MEFRYHDIICWIFPGIFFMGMLILNNILSSFVNLETVFPNDGDKSAMVAALIFCIPVFGMIIGYVLNYGASSFEWLSYKIYDKTKYFGLWRASQRILNNKAIRSRIGDRTALKTLLREKAECNHEVYNNKTAGECLTKIKQLIDTQKLDTFYYKCTFGRNLAFAQLIILLLLLAASSISWNWTSNWKSCIANAILATILFLAWRRNQHTYIRNCFIEFVKTFKNEETEQELRQH